MFKEMCEAARTAIKAVADVSGVIGVCDDTFKHGFIRVHLREGLFKEFFPNRDDAYREKGKGPDCLDYWYHEENGVRYFCMSNDDIYKEDGNETV